MVYSSIQNQLNNLAHFFFGFILLFVLYPKFIFSSEGQSKIENLMANFIKMVFFVIIMGYLLVITRFYGFIGIMIILSVVFYIKNFGTDNKVVSSEVITKIGVYFYDFVHKNRNPVEDILAYNKNKLKEFISKIFHSKSKIINYLLLSVIIGYSAYLRFFDAITSAVPGTSDGNVTLAWMKYIAGNELFHDGIYPHGFHIYLATLQKFAHIDPIYIQKYGGPFNIMMVILGIYIVIYKFTDRPGIGIIGASIYGILYKLLPIEWSRQAATNSQEFAFVFVLPTIYFAYKYIKNNNKNDLLTTFCGVAILMLVHTVALSFAAIGIISLSLAAVILKIKTNFKRVVHIGVSSFLAVIIGVLPIGYGILMGMSFNSSSKDFLLATMKVDYPELKDISYIAIVSIVIMLLYFIIKIKSFSSNLFELFILFFSINAFSTYYVGGVLTNSSVIATRFSELWGLVIPISISIGIYIISKILIKSFIKFLLEIMLVFGIASYTFMIVKPLPIVPYKMEWDSRVEQYLKIDKLLKPKEWMIVSQAEDYAIVLGSGYHLETKDLLKLYDPLIGGLVRKDTKEVSFMKDIFIYYEKNIFTTSFDNMKAEYKRREQEKPVLKNWIKDYEENHNNMSKFYEDDNLIIYRIHQGSDKEEASDDIWAK